MIKLAASLSPCLPPGEFPSPGVSPPSPSFPSLSASLSTLFSQVKFAYFFTTLTLVALPLLVSLLVCLNIAGDSPLHFPSHPILSNETPHNFSRWKRAREASENFLYSLGQMVTKTDR